MLVAGIGYAGLLPIGPREPQQVVFSSVGPVGMVGNARLVPVADGTDIEIDCVYPAGYDHPSAAYSVYVILVVDRNGQVTEVKRWPAKPNKQMTPSAHTDLKLSRIESVEIRDGTTNQPVLRAQLR